MLYFIEQPDSFENDYISMIK